MNEIIIQMPKNINDNKDSFNFLVCSLYSKIKPITNSKIILDFKKTRWVEGNIVTLLGAIVDTILSNNNKLAFKSVSKSINNLLNKNGFLEKYGLIEQSNGIYKSSIKFEIFTPNDKVKFQKYLKEEFIPRLNLTMSESFERDLRLNLEEVFQNARTHGKCNSIFVCGQYFYNLKKVKFTIIDLGKTIPDNVRTKLPIDTSDIECIHWSTKNGNSTKIGISGGLGLYNLSEFLKDNGGIMQIISSSGYWEQNKNKVIKSSFSNKFDGTIVNIQVNINNKTYISLEEKNEINKNNYISNIF